MALTELDNRIIQEIVTAQGQCLSSKRCEMCPFRGICLPEFLNQPLTPEARLALALRVLSHQFLLGEELTTDEIKRDYSAANKK